MFFFLISLSLDPFRKNCKNTFNKLHSGQVIVHEAVVVHAPGNTPLPMWNKRDMKVVVIVVESCSV